MTKPFILLGALLCLLAVIIGAFGAHGLKNILSENELSTYNLANQYHFYHGLGLMIIGLINQHLNNSKSLILLKAAGWLMLFGILLFSGSLYLMAATNIGSIGILTPLGGICFILAWLFTIIAVSQKQ